MNDDLKDMLEISTAVGVDERMVQGGGGNTSVKTDGGGLMYVKASGTSLGEMEEGRGYRLVDAAECRAIVEDEQIKGLPPAEREAEVLRRLVAACRDELPGRPSVETSLHAMLGRCVVHTHPSIVNGLLCAEDGREVIAELFADLDPPYLYVGYAGAGYTLAKRLQAELSDYEAEHGRRPELIFLENHGLFVTTEEAERALELTRQVFEAIEARAREAVAEANWKTSVAPDPEWERTAVAEVAAAMRRFYAGVFGGPALVRFQHGEVVTHFLRCPKAPELAQAPPLVPDQVVYCRDSAVWVELPEDPGQAQDAVTDALSAVEAGVDTPVCVLAAGIGLFCAAPSAKLLEASSSTMRAVLEMLTVASLFGGARGLSEEALDFLHGWEVERFRRTMVARAGADGGLAGKVALVTGAGSGLGRGISLCLARKGMHVVLADIDPDGAEETARRLEEQEADGSALPLRADVTDEETVRALFEAAVRELGGVDLLVNCAGIAPAHPLAEFPAEDWRRALEVNLTGYFIVAREAARSMIRQGTGGSIINISSKTGLEASKHNSAYNATKAGQIHLARGWALDLAEHGIRVNCVCPGNVFTESQIWNEQYIEAAARKRGIEPDEVIPYYVGLTALKEEITWDDVGEAVAFLAGEGASKITGQTLVVDAGQVFVR